MQVANEQALTRQLAARGYVLTAAQSRQATTIDPVAPKAVADSPGVDSRTMALFYAQMASSLRAGITPYRALVQLAGATRHPVLSRALTQMAPMVESGGTVSTAMARFPAIFQGGAVGLVQAAELGGFLDAAMRLLGDQSEQDDALRRSFRPWLWYLLAILLAALFLALPVAAFMRPAIGGGLEAGLRAYTHFVLTRSLPAAIALILAALAIRLTAASPAMRPKWDAFVLRVPFLGRLARLRAGHTIVRTIATLYRGGIAPSAAWRAASAAVPNRALAGLAARSQPLVEQGAPYSQAMRQTGLFREPELGMMQTGETTGDVEEMFEKVANYFRMEVEATLQQIPMVGRTAMLLIAGVIAAVALGTAYKGYFDGLFRGVDDYFAAP